MICDFWSLYMLYTCLPENTTIQTSYFGRAPVSYLYIYIYKKPDGFPENMVDDSLIYS